MKSLRLSCAVASSLAAFFLPAPVSAYDFEASLSITDLEDSSDPVFGLDVTYFFAPVAHGGRLPWDEVTFLERIGSLRGAATHRETNTRYSSTIGRELPFEVELDNDIRENSLKLDYREPGSPHVFTADLKYTESEINGQYIWRSGRVDTIAREDEGIAAGVGYDCYLSETWTAGGGVEYSDQPFADVYTLTARTDRLWETGNGRWAGLTATGGFNRREQFDLSDEGWMASLTGRYYFNPKTSAHAGIGYTDQHSKARTLILGVSRYLNDFIFVQLASTHSEFDLPSGIPESDLDDSHTTVTFSIGARL